MDSQTPQEILEHFHSTYLSFFDHSAFSESPGIYAVYLMKESLPLPGSHSSLPPGSLLYIGKTESSQKKRDVNQHFTSHKTGSSTLRRTLGALLRDKLGLKPLPRSQKETTDNKYKNYRFDPAGEDALTSWMKNNLGLAFYDFQRSPQEISQLEISLIRLAAPPLNLQDNPSNPYSAPIKAARKSCVEAARKADSSVINDSMQNLHTRERQVSKNHQNTTLHAAMIAVLKECPGETTSYDFLAEEIAKRRLYLRKDGQPPPKNQLSARVNKYPQYFEKLPGGYVRLKS